jgi:putative acetyltransferase
VRIDVDDLSRPAVRELLAEHLRDMHATSPPESVHALDLSGLLDPAVTVWTAWAVNDPWPLLGIAALRELDPAAGEVKSMRTTPTARGQGIGSALLCHVTTIARERGYTRLSLETGTQDYFAAARRLYARHGFEPCGPFGDYRLDPNSAYLTLTL